MKINRKFKNALHKLFQIALSVFYLGTHVLFFITISMRLSSINLLLGMVYNCFIAIPVIMVFMWSVVKHCEIEEVARNMAEFVFDIGDQKTADTHQEQQEQQKQQGSSEDKNRTIHENYKEMSLKELADLVSEHPVTPEIDRAVIEKLFKMKKACLEHPNMFFLFIEYYNKIVNLHNRNAYVENGDNATLKTYIVGDFMLWKGVLYTVSSNIPRGDPISGHVAIVHYPSHIVDKST